MQNEVLAQCSATTGATFTNGCTNAWFSSISASGTSVTSTVSGGTSSCTGSYHNYFSTLGIIAPTGATVNFSMTKATGYSSDLYIYVDWNNDGNYVSSELVGTAITGWGGSAVTYSFTIPLTGIVTNTPLHMRVFHTEPRYTHVVPCSGKYGDCYDYYLEATCSPAAMAVSPASPTICASGTVSLTASGAGSSGFYSWTPSSSLSSSTGATVTATPASTTTYTVTGYGPAVCETDTTVTVTTTTSGTLTPVITNSGGTIICYGATTTLSAYIGAGATYQWYDGGIAISGATDSAYVVTGTSSTTISVTVTTTCGSGSASQAIVVNPMPANITGITNVCAGDITNLSETSTGGNWTSSNSTVATVNTSGAVTGILAGTSDIYYRFPTGCGVYIRVTVNPLPGTITGASTVCERDNILLNTTSTTGNWSSSNTAVATVSAGGVVYGVSAGTVVISYTLPTGCSVTKTITVNAAPSAISGPTSVCEGSTISLSSSPAAGSWSSSNGAVATIGTSSGTLTGVAAGTTTITYTSTLGCRIATTETVVAVPAAIAGPSTLCTGNTVSLSNPSGAGNWTSSNTSRATVGSSSGIVTGVAAGTATITFSQASGCIATILVTVNITPSAIGGPSNVCTNSTISLSNPYSGGSWTSRDASIAAASTLSGAVTGVSAGSTDIVYTLSGCSATKTITVDPQPGAVVTPLGDTMLCPGGFVVLSASYGSTYRYQWSGSSGTISGATNDYYLATTGSNYQVTVTNSFNCSSVSRVTAVSVNPATATLTYTGASSICSNSSATLNANLGVGLTYQWLNSGTAISGATSATLMTSASGNYEVIVANAAGCSDISSAVSITAIPAPDATLGLSGPLSFCTGTSLTMSAYTGTGLTYQWQSSGTNITGATNASYTTTTSGNFQVVITSPFPCTSTSTVVAASSVPLSSAAISVIGSSTICFGGTSTIYVPAVAGDTYQWYRNGVAIAGANAASYVAPAAGLYTARVTNVAGCANTTSPAFEVYALDNPYVIARSRSSFCWGGNALLGLSAGGTIGVTFQWQYNGVDIAGATNNIYYATATGSYACTITVAGGCTVTAAPTNVIQFPLPNPVISYDGITLSTGNFYQSYQWYRNLAPVSGNTPWFMPTDLGDYSVKVIDSNGCQSVSNIYRVTRVGNTRPTGVATTSVEGISIYPNPAQGIVHVVSATPLSAVISAIDGRKVMEQSDASEINISALTDGVYTLMLFDGAGQMVSVQKLIKD